jgi:hypothetical protein
MKSWMCPLIRLLGMRKVYLSQDAIDQNDSQGLFSDPINAFSLFTVLSDSYPSVHQTLEKFTLQDLLHSSPFNTAAAPTSITNRVFTPTPGFHHLHSPRRSISFAPDKSRFVHENYSVFPTIRTKCRKSTLDSAHAPTVFLWAGRACADPE